MRLLLLTLLAVVSASAQSTEQLAIERARTTLVYTFDKSLPKISLEDFLNQATKNGTLSWESNDCGEQSGDPEVDSQRDIPICAQATLKAANGRTVYVSVAVGTVHKGISGRPELYDVSLVQPDQSSDSVQLRDLPSELNRP